MSTPSQPGRERGGVLSVRPFRRLWIALSLSSLGDWLSIVALTELAATLTGKHGGGSIVGGATAAQSAAVSGVWIATLLPALLFGPVAGAVADRLNRRTTMITGDVIRGVLFATIPFFPNLAWIYVVKFLAGCASLFWNPATAATVPNLVPKDKLERANQLSLLTTYGTAPVAAGLFSVLALISGPLSHAFAFLQPNKVNLALYINAASYAVSALTIWSLREIGQRHTSERISVPSAAKSIWEGWLFLRRTPVLRALGLGLCGAFAAAGVVIGLGYVYVTDTLHGGSAGWGLVFAAIFVGLALGMLPGARLRDFSLRRLFGLSIVSAAVPLGLIALVPNLALVTILVVLLGALAGIAYATGYTIVGLEVDDDTRGRTFAFFQSTIQVILFLVIALSGFLSSGFTKLISGITGSGNVRVGSVVYHSAGQNVVILLGALVAATVGVFSYKKMDDRPGIPLAQDLIRTIRGEPLADVPAPVPDPDSRPVTRRGVLIAFEGGEGAGKTTQARLLSIWLREQGYDVVSTYEPGATKVGMRLRAVLLDTAHVGLSPRAEALMYAADRAEHVSAVIRPALDRGAIVVTDRYIDSSLAYQGTGRELPLGEVTRINRWATAGLVADLTILLDVPPPDGLGRRARSADRLEAEPQAFHDRVRAGFRKLAADEPRRYLVLDATRTPAELSQEIRDRVREILPDPVPPSAEAETGDLPAVSSRAPSGAGRTGGNGPDAGEERVKAEMAGLTLVAGAIGEPVLAGADRNSAQEADAPPAGSAVPEAPAEAEEETSRDGAADALRKPDAEAPVSADDAKAPPVLADDAEAPVSADDAKAPPVLADDAEAPVMADDAKAPPVLADDAEAPVMADDAKAPPVLSNDAEAPVLADDAEAPVMADDAKVPPVLADDAEAPVLADDAEGPDRADETEAPVLADDAEVADRADEAEAPPVLADETEDPVLADDAKGSDLADDAEVPAFADEAEAAVLADYAEAADLADDAEAAGWPDDGGFRGWPDDSEVPDWPDSGDSGWPDISQDRAWPVSQEPASPDGIQASPDAEEDPGRAAAADGPGPPGADEQSHLLPRSGTGPAGAERDPGQASAR